MGRSIQLGPALSYNPTMSIDLIKTFTYLAIHLTVAFTIGYLLTGSLEIAGMITLIEPCANAVAFFFHEKVWKRILARRARRLAVSDPSPA
jgi:uncharacterized membrane protein